MAGSASELAAAPLREGATAEALERLEALLARGSGAPVKYRLACWPVWLGVAERRSRAEAAGRGYGFWADGGRELLPEHVRRSIDADLPRTRDDLPDVQKAALCRVLVAFARFCPVIGYSQGLNHLAGVFLKLGFEDEVTFWMLVSVLEELTPQCHAGDLQGLFRDTAVADVLLQTFLPAHVTALAASGCELLWLTTDYFITIGTKDMPFSLVLRLWDFCFLHGVRALFAGFMAHLELSFPVPERSNDHEGAWDFEAAVAAYAAASRKADPEAFASRLRGFLHHRQGGISEELITELRSTFSGATAGSVASPSTASEVSSFASESPTEKADVVGIVASSSAASMSPASAVTSLISELPTEEVDAVGTASRGSVASTSPASAVTVFASGSLADLADALNGRAASVSLDLTAEPAKAKAAGVATMEPANALLACGGGAA